MSYLLGLKCVTCDQEFSPSKIDYTCPKCGPLYGTLEVQYDYPSIQKKFTKENLQKNKEATHWRYLPLLPIEDPSLILPLAVGWTPLYPSSTLEKEWNLKNIWIKDDGRNPTASLKDRASSVGIVKALEKKSKVVTTASTGNAASSWSAFTALAGLKTYIFVPQTAPKAKVAQLLLSGSKVLKVKGTYDEAFELCCQASKKWGWYNRSTAINPYLGEGKKTASLEICEQLSWKVPDYVFVSVGDGCIFQGMWKGFKELYEMKFIDKLPKMIGVQAKGSSPLVEAFEKKATVAKSIVPSTLADSISVGVPRDQIKALKAVYESDGKFISVTDDAILSAISILAKKVGVLAEPAGATAMAGLKKMVDQGVCSHKDKVVVMVTGHGLKDVDGILKAVDEKPVVVGTNLEELAKVI